MGCNIYIPPAVKEELYRLPKSLLKVAGWLILEISDHGILSADQHQITLHNWPESELDELPFGMRIYRVPNADVTDPPLFICIFSLAGREDGICLGVYLNKPNIEFYRTLIVRKNEFPPSDWVSLGDLYSNFIDYPDDRVVQDITAPQKERNLTRYYDYMTRQAWALTLRDLSGIFNWSDKMNERLMTRIDFVFATFQSYLQKERGVLNIEVTFPQNRKVKINKLTAIEPLPNWEEV